MATPIPVYGGWPAADCAEATIPAIVAAKTDSGLRTTPHAIVAERDPAPIFARWRSRNDRSVSCLGPTRVNSTDAARPLGVPGEAQNRFHDALRVHQRRQRGPAIRAVVAESDDA